jgi:hypothetical protein
MMTVSWCSVFSWLQFLPSFLPSADNVGIAGLENGIGVEAASSSDSKVPAYISVPIDTLLDLGNGRGMRRRTRARERMGCQEVKSLFISLQ